MRATDAARVMALLGLRNITSNKVKSTIVGSIILFGTALLVVGTSLLDSVEASMEKVVTSSLAGHLQVYSSQGRDELSLFGGLTASLPDIGEIEDFAALREAIVGEVDGVQAVVPMGIGVATGTSGNDIDRAIAALRFARQEGDASGVASARGQLVEIAKLVEKDYTYREEILADRERAESDREALARFQTDAFWEVEFEEDPAAALMELETKLAPLAADGRLFFLRYLGTDPTLFERSFDRFKIAKGQKIPPMKRGVLLSNRVHERFLKHRIARQMDKIKTEIEEEGRVIGVDEDLTSRVSRMSRQYKRILYQLDPGEAERLESELRAYLPADEAPEGAELSELVSSFLSVTEANFYDRYAWFYEHIAPKIDLYRVNVGDVVALQSFTRRGYIKAVNVKIWGTFQFEGIEDSDLAGTVNLMDLLTFRELYGRMTDEQRAELEQIREEVGVEDVERDGVEDALFGGEDADLEATFEEAEDDELEVFDGEGAMSRAERVAQVAEATYAQSELDEGLALNAAIVLEDGSRAPQVKARLEAMFEREGMALKVVDWQQAAGLVGQLIVVIRLVLYVAITIIFLVALVIINNSMVMATMDRVSEIGTMRAMGAQRGFILWMFMFETFVLGALSGAAGAALGAGAIVAMGTWGLPATNEIVRFIFAGPRLYPEFTTGNLLFAVAVIFAVSVVSTLYPAIVAMRVQPVVAMRGRE